MDAALKRKFSAVRKYFPHTDNVIYLNTGSNGPYSTLLHNAVTANLDQRTYMSKDDSHVSFASKDNLRKGYAKLIGAKTEDVGISLSTTFGLNIAAFGLPLKAGDEVLISDIEFPALAYTWRSAAEERKLKLKFIKSHNSCYSIENLKKAITIKTKVVAVSFVQFFNGYKNDLKTIGEICRKNNIYFVVDGIQGMGAEPIDVKKLGIDIFSSGCQKWMLSPQGCGFFYLSEEIRDKLKHPFMSWLGADWKVEFTSLFRYNLPYFDSSQRFEMGYFATLNLLGMQASLKLFEKLGINNISKHNHDLIDVLAEYINQTDYYKITSSMAAKHRSSIFTFTCDKTVELHEYLLKNKIVLVRREGSIRVSVHLFNNLSDIKRLISMLKKFVEKQK